MKRTKYVLYLVAALTILADQLLKWLVRSTLRIGQTVVVIPRVVAFLHLQNPGAAFSMFPHDWWFFVVIALVVALVVIIVHHRYRFDALSQVGLGLLLGGALGNMIDRLVLPGHTVTDYVDFYTIHFAIFNLADASIDIGVLLLLISSFRNSSTADSDEREDPRS